MTSRKWSRCQAWSRRRRPRLRRLNWVFSRALRSGRMWLFLCCSHGQVNWVYCVFWSVWLMNYDRVYMNVRLNFWIWVSMGFFIFVMWCPGNEFLGNASFIVSILTIRSRFNSPNDQFRLWLKGTQDCTIWEIPKSSAYFRNINYVLG